MFNVGHLIKGEGIYDRENEADDDFLRIVQVKPVRGCTKDWSNCLEDVNNIIEDEDNNYYKLWIL